MHHKKNLRHALAMAPLALVASAGLAAASGTFPPVKTGLWTNRMVMHLTMAGQPPDTDTTPQVTYNCLDSATMAATLKAMAGSMMGCVFDIEGSGGSYTVSTKCTNPHGLTGTIDGSGTLTMTGDTAMHLVDKTTSNLQNMQMSGDTTADSHWVSDCPAGVVPGDFGTMENGVFVKKGNSLAVH